MGLIKTLVALILAILALSCLVALILKNMNLFPSIEIGDEEKPEPEEN